MNDFTLFDDAVRSVWRYPGGEVGVRALGQAPARLLARVQCSDDLMALVMYLGAVPGAVQEVCIPYLPYARQDRVAVAGDPIAVDVLARLLASTGVRRFATLDAHSQASDAAFAAAGCTLTNVAPSPFLARHLADVVRRDQPLWFVAPDKGAATRTAAVAAALTRTDRPIGLVQCAKVRDPVTGKLRGFEVASTATAAELGRDPALVIVDDICDGGGTFLGVAEALRARFGPVALHLFTTHGIHSKGLDELASVFATIGATDSFRSGHTHERLRIVPLQNQEQPR
ncbi:MAG: ribose-phosphate pyrophosphokinase [Planctomycetes bacterium]|nr:ribose-phosphate pyrophosphokinase [Planctomycetota bacterium]